jgi:hypothetical protein
MNLLKIFIFFYKSYLHFNKYNFIYLLILSIISGLLNGVTLFLIFAFIQFLTSRSLENDLIQSIYFYLTQFINISNTYFLLFLVIFTFSLKIYVNGSYFLKSEHFRINVSTYLAQKRIKTYDDNIISDLTVHLTKSDTFNELLLAMLLQLSSVIFSIFILLSLNLGITVMIFFIVIPILYFTSVFFSKRVINNVKNYNNSMYDYTSMLTSYNIQSSNDLTHFTSKTLELKKFQLAISRSRFLSTNFYEIVFFLLILFLLIIDLDNKVIYLGLFLKIITSFQTIIQSNQKIQIRFESFKKFYE